VPSYEHIQAIVRASDILELICNATPSGLRLKEVSGALNLPRQTTYNILRTLVHKGLLAKEGAPARYKVGPALGRLRDRQVKWHRDFLGRATPVVIRLARALSTEVEVGIHLAAEIVIRIRAHPQQDEGLEYVYSGRTPHYGTAVLCQAFMDQSELNEYRTKHPMSQRDREFWKSYELLDDFLTLVRQEGYLAFVKSEVFRAAAAVFDEANVMRAMIRASKRYHGLLPTEAPRWIALIRRAADELSSIAGRISA